MIRIYGDKIAVIPIADPDMIGSIYVPDVAKERADQGIVKYVGPDVKDIRPGMYVTFAGYTGTLFIMDGEGKLIIMPEDKVAAVIPTPPNVEVPGLYFRGSDGQYFPANYEQAMNIIASSFTEFGETLRMRERIEDAPNPTGRF